MNNPFVLIAIFIYILNVFTLIKLQRDQPLKKWIFFVACLLAPITLLASACVNQKYDQEEA
jgi:hypothetical protein